MIQCSKWLLFPHIRTDGREPTQDDLDKQEEEVELDKLGQRLDKNDGSVSSAANGGKRGEKEEELHVFEGFSDLGVGGGVRVGALDELV